MFKEEDFGPSTRHLKRYLKLLSTRPTRKKVKGDYLERHHIYPTCVFGENKVVIVLTIREHLLAHELIWRHYHELNSPHQYKLGFPLQRIVNGNVKAYSLEGVKISSRAKEISRIAMHNSVKGENNPFYGKKHTQESLALMSIKHKEHKVTEETRNKISESSKRIWQTPGYREKMSIAISGRPMSDKMKDILRKANLHRVITSETRAKISASNKGKLLGVPKPAGFAGKISAYQKGRKHSDEHVDKVNRNPEKIRKTAEKHRGMKRSEETKANISASRIGKPASNKGIVLYYHPATMHKLSQHKDLPIPDGYIRGNPGKPGGAAGKSFWYHPETLECKPFLAADVPVGWVKGNLALRKK